MYECELQNVKRDVNFLLSEMRRTNAFLNSPALNTLKNQVHVNFKDGEPVTAINSKFARDFLDALEEGYFQEWQKQLEREEKERIKLNQRLKSLITNVKFDNPWTIVFWNDGKITRCKCAADDTFDKTTGLLACIAKKFYEENPRILSVMINKWCDLDESKSNEEFQGVTYDG